KQLALQVQGSDLTGIPPVTHAVSRLNAVKTVVQLSKLPTDTFDVGGHGVVIQHRAGGFHQLVSAADVAWMLHQRVQHPELGYGQVNRLIVPGDRPAVDVHRSEERRVGKGG